MGKNILMLCYYFPPLTDVGCKRSVAFAKYFKQAGWNPYVLSVKNPDRTYCALGTEAPPEGVEVDYCRSLVNPYKFLGKVNGLLGRILGRDLQRNYLYDLFCIPDIFIGWIPLALARGLKLIREKNIDVIYVSCSPFSSGITGLLLKRLTGKPLVIDYRDPFGLDISAYQKNFWTPRFRKPINRWIAGRILNSCDLFTVTTEETRQLYLEQFPFAGEKIHTVHNGFDHTFLDGLESRHKFSKFTVIYTGNFYYDVPFAYFFEGLGLLKKQGEISSADFQFLFYGGHTERIEDALQKYDVADLVSVRERIPYDRVLEEITRSHLQLLRIIQPMISTKLFEGMAMNTPFLATIPSGEVERLIKKYSPGSFIVTDQSAASVGDKILSAMASYQENRIPANAIADFLEEFSRHNLSNRMIGLIEQLY